MQLFSTHHLGALQPLLKLIRLFDFVCVGSTSTTNDESIRQSRESIFKLLTTPVVVKQVCQSPGVRLLVSVRVAY